jgi:hypothetical protein
MGAAMGIAMGKTMVTGSGGRDAACKQFRDVWMLARIVDEDTRVGLQWRKLLSVSADPEFLTKRDETIFSG